MSLSHDDFLKSIRQSFNDEEPRRVYADWLEERGDVRGAWIRAELEFHALVDDDHQQEILQSHLAELACQIDPTWLAQIDRGPLAWCMAGDPQCPTHWEKFDTTENPLLRHCSVCGIGASYCFRMEDVAQCTMDQHIALGSAVDRTPLWDAYQDFASMAFDNLMSFTDAMPEVEFWPIIESLDWPCNHHRDYAALAAELASRISLEKAVGVADLALSLRWEVEEQFENNADFYLGAHIASEDGMDDFGYHLVGMGQSFFETFREDQQAAIEIAQGNLYVESLRYVLRGASSHYSVSDYCTAYEARGRLVTPEDRHWQMQNGSFIALASPTATLPGLGRIGDGVMTLQTPLGERRIDWPKNE